jgi:chain length determinant protein tyrosine kinase EpsG
MGTMVNITEQQPAVTKERSIGRLLLETGKINPGDADRILHAQKEQGLRFGEAAIKLGLVTGQDIQQVLSQQFDYPCLPPGSEALDPELVAAFHPHDPEVEALRVLRSQIALRWYSEHKSMVVTGARGGQGTSHVAANLAVVFSQLGERTLLIDADLRNPRQHHLFRLKNSRGLSDILAGRASADVIQPVAGMADLSLLTAGTVPPNPQELLGRSTLAELLNLVAPQYDVILLDTPPALDCSDAQTLSARIGGALIVVRRNHAKIDDVEEVKRQLAIADAQMVGAVLNEF